MIISDDHRAAFIHIPKCGGTSVRKQLSSIDSYQGAFWDVVEHPSLGVINTSHIPLAVLAEHFPVEFEKVGRYRSFALIREPYARFASATFQRFEEFKDVNRVDVTLELALEEARRAMAWLKARGPFCDAEYIHFSRQIDYVTLNERRVVSDVFSLDDLESMASALEACCGVALDSGRRDNTNFASNNRILAILHGAKPIYSRLTTWAFRERVVVALQKLKLHDTTSLYATFARDPSVVSFVEDYYRDDLALYHALTTNAANSETDAMHSYLRSQKGVGPGSSFRLRHEGSLPGGGFVTTRGEHCR